MENNRYSTFIRVLGGGYLGYTGFHLVQNCIQEKPDNFVFFMAVGILFLVVGIFFVVSGIKLLKKSYDNAESAQEAEADEPEEEPQEPVLKVTEESEEPENVQEEE